MEQRVSAFELCSDCGGNGVKRLSNGVEECQRCDGRGETLKVAPIAAVERPANMCACGRYLNQCVAPHCDRLDPRTLPSASERERVIEECARVAETLHEHPAWDHDHQVCERYGACVAVQIRALATNAGGEG